mmetsp:Transcript_42216/g.119388  ORF Transcript_42216/g.119388 Transcript_42216/m.119388 type:complete len:261 (+) Transcript_42216:1420-2202(+)
MEICFAWEPGWGAWWFGKAAVSVSSRRITCGKENPKPRILEENHGAGLSCQRIAICTVATAWPLFMIATLVGEGWHSPFITDGQVATPTPKATSVASGFTCTSCTGIFDELVFMSTALGITPALNSEMWSRYSTVPQFTCGVVSKVCPFAKIFTLYFLLKSTTGMPVTRIGYTVNFWRELPLELPREPAPSRMTVTLPYGRPSIAIVARSRPAKSPRISSDGFSITPSSKRLVNMSHSGGHTSMSFSSPVNWVSKPLTES